jgi:hypothetical protein
MGWQSSAWTIAVTRGAGEHSLDAVARAFHRRRLMDSGLRLGIVHVMKTAGTSLRALLSTTGQAYTGPCYLETRTDVDMSDWDDEGRSMVFGPGDLVRRFEQRPAVMGHVLARSYLDAGATQLILTVREPRARLLSLLRYYELDPEATGHSGALGQAMQASACQCVSDFLETWPLPAYTRNSIAHFMLCSLDELPADINVTASLDDVLPALHAAHWSQDGAAMIASIEALLQMPISKDAMPRLNVARIPTQRSPQAITPDDLLRLREYTALDTWLLEELMASGVLSHRDQSDLDLEFTQTAHRLGFTFVDH